MLQVPHQYDSQKDVHTMFGVSDKEYAKIKPVGEPVLMTVPHATGFSKIRIGSKPVKAEGKKRMKIAEDPWETNDP